MCWILDEREPACMYACKNRVLQGESAGLCTRPRLERATSTLDRCRVAIHRCSNGGVYDAEDPNDEHDVHVENGWCIEALQGSGCIQDGRSWSWMAAMSHSRLENRPVLRTWTAHASPLQRATVDAMQCASTGEQPPSTTMHSVVAGVGLCVLGGERDARCLGVCGIRLCSGRLRHRSALWQSSAKAL
jgi:hypothetical protein